MPNPRAELRQAVEEYAEAVRQNLMNELEPDVGHDFGMSAQAVRNAKARVERLLVFYLPE